jgi:hypothetical protein
MFILLWGVWDKIVLFPALSNLSSCLWVVKFELNSFKTNDLAVVLDIDLFHFLLQLLKLLIVEKRFWQDVLLAVPHKGQKEHQHEDVHVESYNFDFQEHTHVRILWHVQQESCSCENSALVDWDCEQGQGSKNHTLWLVLVGLQIFSGEL